MLYTDLVLINLGKLKTPLTFCRPACKDFTPYQAAKTKALGGLVVKTTPIFNRDKENHSLLHSLG